METKTRRLKLKRLCKGLYYDHGNGMTLLHEVMWRKSEGRMWVAKWLAPTLMGLGHPEERSKKFRTAAEARAHLTNLLASSR